MITHEVQRATEALFDAFEKAENGDHQVSYWDRQSGVVDAQGVEIADALVAAGWIPPQLVENRSPASFGAITADTLLRWADQLDDAGRLMDPDRVTPRRARITQQR